MRVPSNEIMRMCVNGWLKVIRAKDERIRETQHRIAMAESMLGSMGAGLVPPGGGNKDALPDGVVRLLELRDELNARIVEGQADYEAALDLCQPPNYGRYAVWIHEVEGRTWAYVGRIIGYSERRTRQLAAQGYRELYLIMPEEYRRNAFPEAEPWDG